MADKDASNSPREQILVAAVVFFVLALVVILVAGCYKAVQWWKVRRRRDNTQKRLADIELEFATEDDDDELLNGTIVADDEWSCIDTRADESVSASASFAHIGVSAHGPKGGKPQPIGAAGSVPTARQSEEY
mmetsp:Transcript_3558/g.10217  ORF Transcript_3558/g.10217 Transcript_3558/m.10217 type:complete len:132 (+) Transcript_3558:82-477(+)